MKTLSMLKKILLSFLAIMLGFSGFAQTLEEKVKTLFNRVDIDSFSCSRHLFVIWSMHPSICGNFVEAIQSFQVRALAEAGTDGCIHYLFPKQWESDSSSAMQFLRNMVSLPCEHIHYVLQIKDFRKLFTADELRKFLSSIWEYFPDKDSVAMLVIPKERKSQPCRLIGLWRKKIDPNYDGELTQLVYADSTYAIFLDRNKQALVVIDHETLQVNRVFHLDSLYCQIYDDLVTDSACLRETNCNEIKQFLTFGGTKGCTWEKAEFKPIPPMIILHGNCRYCDAIRYEKRFGSQPFAVLSVIPVNVTLTFPEFEYMGIVQIFYAEGEDPFEPLGCIEPSAYEPIASGYIDNCGIGVFISRNVLGVRHVLVVQNCYDQQLRYCMIPIKTKIGTESSAVVRNGFIYLWTGYYLISLYVR